MPVDVRLCCTVALSPNGPAPLVPDGVTLVIVSPAAETTTRAAVTKLRTFRAQLPSEIGLVVAGRVDWALAAGLDGVQLGPDDLGPIDARRLLGADKAIGVAVVDPAGADELYRWRVDYALAGSDAAALGSEELARIAFRVRLASPATRVVARGGPSAEGARNLVSAGAEGVLIRADEGEGPAAFDGLRAAIDGVLARRTPA